MFGIAFLIAQASGVTFTLDTDAIPVADASRRDACLRWGDDYELLFTAPPAVRLPLSAHRIGTVTERGKAPLVLGAEPLTEPASLGYQHG